jgi:hypothetical protein
VFGIAAQLFEPILDLWQILKLCRFAVLTILVAAYLIILNSQGQEVLIRLQADGGLRGNLAFLVAVILWAWVLWYSCRVMLGFQFAQWPPRNASRERKARIQWWHRIAPRALGVAAFLVVGYALIKSTLDTEFRSIGVALGILYVACAGLFAFIVRKRHDWAARLRRQSPLVKRVLGNPPPGEQLYLESYHQLPKPRKWGVAAFLIGLWLVPFVLFQTPALNLALAPMIMSATIFLLAAASWVPIGSILVYWSGHYRIPIFTILFVYLVFVSTLNDNHHIRTAPGGSEPQPEPAKAFERWVKDRVARTERNQPLPVILVAAEGGGIRAAYWAASVLTRIQQDRQDFASQIFVISGVSGGSLGAGVFAALVADQDGSGPCSDSKAFLDCARRMLRMDFLAPTFATMLYPDLLQRFLFRPVPHWDRARTLETSWEQAWESVAKSPSNRFAEPFDDLWTGPHSGEVPNLIFNMTSVEHGNRVLISNLQTHQAYRAHVCLEAFTGQAPGIFDDVIDLREAMNAYPCNMADAPTTSVTIRLSTAINNSARFSFISPAGTVNERLHIVDGGYFEDSGTATLEEVYQKIRPQLSEGHVLIVLYIDSEPDHRFQIGVLYRGSLDAIVEGAPKRCIRVEIQGEVPAELRDGSGTCPPWPTRAPNEAVLVAEKSLRSMLQVGRFYTIQLDKDGKLVKLYEPDIVPLDEVATPFYTIFRARLARGSQAFQHLQRRVEAFRSSRFIHIQLRKGTATLPLGWTLSNESSREMDRQLDTAFQNCRKENKTLFDYFAGCWPDDAVLHEKE